MASGTPQDPQLRPIRTLAPEELHHGAVPDQVTAEDAELEAGGATRFAITVAGWTCWSVGSADARGYSDAPWWPRPPPLAIPTLRQLLPDLKLLTTAGPAAPAENTAPIKPPPAPPASPAQTGQAHRRRRRSRPQRRSRCFPRRSRRPNWWSRCGGRRRPSAEVARSIGRLPGLLTGNNAGAQRRE